MSVSIAQLETRAEANPYDGEAHGRLASTMEPAAMAAQRLAAGLLA